jgi:hypothetical protein
MKKLFAIILLLPFISCIEDDNAAENITDTNSFLEATQNERWVISKFVEEGRDLTTNYLGSTFLFAEERKLTVENGSEFSQGSWRIERDENISELYLQFVNNRLLEELNEDWEIVEFSSSRISLIEADDTEIDTLIFVRAGAVENNTNATIIQAKALADKIQDQSFSIVKVTDDREDYTQAMKDIELSFGKNRSLQLKQGNQILALGIWLIGTENNEVVLELDLSDNRFAEYVDEEWKLLEINGIEIRFEEADGNDKDLLTIRQK